MQTHLPASTPFDAVVESTGRHAHDKFQLAWVRTGMGRVYCRGAAHDAPAGTVVVVPPGEMHHGHSVGADGWGYLILDAAPLEEIAAELPGRRTAEFAWVTCRDAPLAAAFARWAGARERGLAADSLAWEAMAALVCHGGRTPAAGREPAAVREAVAFRKPTTPSRCRWSGWPGWRG